MKQYVQHESGKGEKWEVEKEYLNSWKTAQTFMILPKSEYIPCEPPEEYEDVTASYSGCSLWKHIPINRDIDRFKYIDGPHNGPCFIVERRKE